MNAKPPRGPLLPPVYLVADIALMAALHWYLPLVQLIEGPVRIAGALLMLLSVGFGFWAVRLFRKADTGVVPFTPVKALVDSGPFRLTRNPMYFAMTGVLVGTAVLLGSLSPWLVIPVFVALIQWRFIYAEEAMLEEACGQSYLDYKAKVRRWL
jgi:protein-S-isoprenylcysteine O-methyltransferase Ste14